MPYHFQQQLVIAYEVKGSGMSLGASQAANLRPINRGRRVWRGAMSTLVIALTTVAVWHFDRGLEREHLIFVYVLPIAIIAICYGSMSAIAATATCSFIAANLLYPPRFSPLVQSPLHFLELVLFSLLVLFASQVLSGLSKEKDRSLSVKQKSIVPGG